MNKRFQFYTINYNRIKTFSTVYRQRMTAKEIQLVKTSWRTLRSINPLVMGDVFYSKLFFQHSYLKSLFHTSKEEQSKKLVDMLNVIMGRLDKLDELGNDIAALAMRHVQYGVKPQHYAAVGEALLWTVQQGLGKDWTVEMAAAWETCYGELSGAMIKAARKKG